MNPSQLSWLALGLTVPALYATAEAPAPHDLAALEAEYERAYAGWKPLFDAAEGRERKAVRDAHPARTYWPKFEALGKEGHGRAYLWMLEHVGDLGKKRAERGPIVTGLYDALLEGSAGEIWFDEVIGSVRESTRYFEGDALEQWYAKAARTATAPMAQALGELSLAQLLSESDDAKAAEKGTEMVSAYRAKYLGLESKALDFRAKTVEGHEFKLSDYKGKVVLLDFYGFW